MNRIEQNESLRVMFEFEGQTLPAHMGDSVAAALLASDHWVLRTTPVTGAPRGPFCMMGVCFECLVEIDGIGNRQACMVEVRDGMRVRRQHGAAEPGPRPADDEQDSRS